MQCLSCFELYSRWIMPLYPSERLFFFYMVHMKTLFKEPCSLMQPSEHYLSHQKNRKGTS